MTKYIKLKNNKIDGFTLIESVISLFIMILTISLMASLLYLAQKSVNYVPSENKVAFAYIQLEKFLKSDGGFAIKPQKNANQILLVKKKPDQSAGSKTYVIEKYQNMIRITGASSGHMPLISQIKAAQFRVHGKQITINLTEDDGVKSQLVFDTKHEVSDFEAAKS